jgi:hypothetical protein
LCWKNHHLRIKKNFSNYFGVTFWLCDRGGYSCCENGQFLSSEESLANTFPVWEKMTQLGNVLTICCSAIRLRVWGCLVGISLVKPANNFTQSQQVKMI